MAYGGCTAAPPDVQIRQGPEDEGRYAGDEDEKSARGATANRILTVLKAALNYAYQERYVAADDAWRAVKPYKEVDAPVVRYLSSDECRRLVNPCPDDLRQMVRAALLTGCRYGELSRLRCEDVNLDAHSIAIRQSKGGKTRHVVLTSEGVVFFRSIVAGRKARDLSFRAPGRRRLEGSAADPPAERSLCRGQDCACRRFPRASAYLCLDPRYERGADGRYRRPARPCRHTDHREALCPFGA